MSELATTGTEIIDGMRVSGWATMATLDVLGYHCEERDLVRGRHEVGDVVPCSKGLHTHRVLKVILHIPIIDVVVIEGDQPVGT